MHDPGHPDRPRRHDQRQDRVEHADRGRAGAQQPGRRRSTPADQLPPSLLPQVESQAKDRFTKQHDPVDVLLLPEHADEAVQQPAGARGGQLRRSTAARWSRLNERQLQADLLLPARGHRRPPDRRRARTATRTTRRTWPRPSSSSQQSGMAGHAGHGLGPDAQPAQASSSPTTPTCSTSSASRRQPKIIADAQYFPTIGNLKTQRRRPASPTGTRTSRTRRTSTC